MQSKEKLEQNSLKNKLSVLESVIVEVEPQEQEIMQRRLEKLRTRIIYLENASYNRSKHISQMEHQLSSNEVPNHEWDPTLQQPDNEVSTDLYSLVSNILQLSQKAVLENEREDKIIKTFSNAVRHSFVSLKSETKASVFRTHDAFYSKLSSYWKILYPDQEEQSIESIDELADAIGEALKEIKKETSLEKNV